VFTALPMKVKSSQKVKAGVISSVVLLLLNSCTIYLPQPASIPLMNTKNEVQLSGGVTMLGGVDGSVAYAPGQHVAMQLYGSLHTTQISYFQGAIGYYMKSKSALNFEIYGGIATGNGENFGFNSLNNANGGYMLYFGQTNIGQTNLGSAHIDYGFGLKSGMFDVTINDYFSSLPAKYNTTSWLIEPQGFIRMGGEKLKVGFQINIVTIFTENNSNPMIFYYPANFGLSINYRITPSAKRGK
jgi:hypothetical protein